jgi:hypothetical protein
MTEITKQSPVATLRALHYSQQLCVHAHVLDGQMSSASPTTQRKTEEKHK